MSTWFVTGSSRGLGRALVEAAVAAGNAVVATARNPRLLDDLATAHPDAVLPVALDVTDRDAVTAAVDTAVARFGGLDVVVNNAGYANLSAIEDTTPEDFRAQVDTNFFGVVNVVQTVLPVLRKQGRGHIVNVSSVGGRAATAGLGAYQSAKWAVGGFSGVLAAEVAPLGISVTVVEPGGMRTDWAGSSMTVPEISAPYQQTVGAMSAMHGQGGDVFLGDPAKVARAIVEITETPDPPQRLLLGSDALLVATAVAERQADSDRRWAELTRSTDRDDATPEQRDPLGIGKGR